MGDNQGQFIQNALVGQSGKGFCALSGEVASSAFYNAGHDFDLPQCHPYTRVAVLDRIKDWTLDRRDSETSLMWVYAAAGAGKSSIARSIAEWCQEEKILLASFFFFRSDPQRNNSKRFIATLAYNIVQLVPNCRALIEQAVESDPHIFTRSLDAQIRHLILNPLSLVAQALDGEPLPHVIIVDGLDECIETQEQTSIIQLFSTTLCQNPSLRWKVLITSRPELAIRCSFNDIANPSTRLALSDEYSAYENIICYLEESFRKIKRKNPNNSRLPCDWPSDEDIEKVVRKSSGQFIYADTVIKYLSSAKCIQARLRTILDLGSASMNGQAEPPFRQLDVLFEHILNSAGAGQVETVKQTTAMCIMYGGCRFKHVCAETCQTPGEIIALILGLEVEDVDCILEQLGSIFEVTIYDVRLYHASFSDILFDPNRAGNLWVDKQLIWSKVVCYTLRTLPTVPNGSFLHVYWIKTLDTALRKARLTEEVTQCLSFDLTPLFDTQDRLFEMWTDFFYFLRERSLEGDDWKNLYHKHISTYDHWLARLLQEKFSVSYSHRAQVAFLSLRPIPFIAFMVPSSKPAGTRYSYLYYYQFTLSGTWARVVMFETNQLPKVKAYMLNDQIQASAVLHCIHFLVQCAVTGRLMHFRLGPDRKKSRPWFWRRRLLAGGHSPPHIRRCPKKTGHHHFSDAPFIPFCSALKTLDRAKPTPNTLTLMDGALRSLLHFLNRATISARLIFAVRVALSLTCTSREIINLWREVETTMTKYLVDVAGLEPRMLGFVGPTTVWQDRVWDRYHLPQNAEPDSYSLR